MQIEYKNIDPKLIVKEVRNGRSLETVQKLYGIRLKSEVQDLYMKGLAELGEIPKMEFNPPRRNAGTGPDSRPSSYYRPQSRHQPATPPPSAPPIALIRSTASRTIGQSGSITLNKTLLIDDLGFTPGDTFEIYREEDKIVLRRMARP